MVWYLVSMSMTQMWVRVVEVTGKLVLDVLVLVGPNMVVRCCLLYTSDAADE